MTTYGANLLGFDWPWQRKVPVTLQSEIAECGLACLAMVASYYGLQIDLITLRSKCAISLAGSTLADIVEYSERLNFSSRAVRLDLSELHLLRAPAILHWDLNHFVVLQAVKNGAVEIVDPALGAITLTVADVSTHFTGIALELTPAATFKRSKIASTLSIQQLWSNARGIAGSATTVILLALVIQGLSASLPYFLQVTLDQGINSGDTHLLTALGLGFGLLTIIKVFAETLRSWTILYFGSHLNLQLGTNLLDHLLKLPLEYFQKRHIGDLQSRFSSLNQIRQTLTGGLVEGIIDGFMAILMLWLMFIYNARLAFITVGATLLYAMVRAALFSSMRRTTLAALTKRASSDTQFLETIRAIQPIKIFGRQGERRRVWQGLQATAINAETQTAQMQIAYQAFQGLSTGLEYIALVWLGARYVVAQQLTVGMLMAFLSYRLMFSQRCQTLTDKISEYRMLNVHLQRIADIALAAPEKDAVGKGFVSNHEMAELQLIGVGFRYSKNDKWLFRNFDITVSKGECVALRGRTGRGKSTLLKIMMGLLEPTEGQVLFGGVDIRDIGLQAYRARCAAVMQDDVLISGSLRDNISFQAANPDDTRIDQSTRLACIDSDISRMPMGIESLIGDMGTALSGGQQQRVLLARALYHQPSVLFLDESTSALDTQTESLVNTNVRALGVTRVIVAHRQETLALADRVIDLNDFAQ